jgi:hypothetical protein
MNVICSKLFGGVESSPEINVFYSAVTDTLTDQICGLIQELDA